jgi:ribosome-associated translation inhibitor RaiA/cold shock CspA family protein
MMEKPLQITFKDTESSEFIEARIRDRVERLQRYNHAIIGCRVVVEVPHKSPGSGKVPLGISVEVEVPGRMLVAKGEEDMHEVKGDRTAIVNRVFEAMERQLEDDSQVRRREVQQSASAVEAGRVARLFPEQEYGFVEVRGSPQLYFTRNALDGLHFEELEEGMMVGVTRATTEGPMGPQASSVRRIGEESRMGGARGTS